MINTITHWIVVGVAFLVALLLVAVGYRQRRETLPKKCSLFGVALVCFLGLLTANASCGETDAPVPQEGNRTEASLKQKLPAEITSPKNWAEFRQLWWSIVGGYQVGEGQMGLGVPINLKLSSQERLEYNVRLCRLFNVADEAQLRASIAASTEVLGGSAWNPKAGAKRLSIPMLVLANASLDMIQGAYESLAGYMPVRMALPANYVSQESVARQILTRLVKLKKLRRQGKVDTKTYRNTIHVVSRDMWFAFLLWGKTKRQATALIGPEGEIMLNMRQPSAVSPTLEEGQKLFPPMSQEETRISRELLKAKDHATVMRLTDAVSLLPSAWMRGLHARVILLEREAERAAQRQRSDDRNVDSLQKHLVQLKAEFEAMRKVYLAQQAVEKYLAENLSPADDVEEK